MFKVLGGALIFGCAEPPMQFGPRGCAPGDDGNIHADDTRLHRPRRCAWFQQVSTRVHAGAQKFEAPVIHEVAVHCGDECRNKSRARRRVAGMTYCSQHDIDELTTTNLQRFKALGTIIDSVEGEGKIGGR